MKRLTILICLVLSGQAVSAQNIKPFVIPEIQEWRGGGGEFIPGEGFAITCTDDALLPVAEALSEDWETMFGPKPEVIKGNAVFYLSDPISGLFAFARDGYLCTFNFRPYPGEKVDICIKGDNKSTSLYVNGRHYETLGIQKRIYENSNRPTYQVRTLVFPLGTTGDFTRRITDLKVCSR